MSVFNNKVVIITGAGSGIGRALGEELARRGANVCLSDVRQDRVEEVAEGIRRAGGRATARVVDVTDYDSVKALIEDVARDHGRLDYMFNNAGISVIGTAAEVDIEDWRKVLAVNLHGVVHGATVAYALMMRQGFGHIVNTGSIAGLVPMPLSSSYVASKHAVVGLSSCLRLEGAERGVRVSVVCPGLVNTAIVRDLKVVGSVGESVMRTPRVRSGMDPAACARHILSGVEKNVACILVPFTPRIFWWLHRLCPSLVLWMMDRVHRHLRVSGDRTAPADAG